jgi:hypothetical protein
MHLCTGAGAHRELRGGHLVVRQTSIVHLPVRAATGHCIHRMNKPLIGWTRATMTCGRRLELMTLAGETSIIGDQICISTAIPYRVIGTFHEVEIPIIVHAKLAAVPPTEAPAMVITIATMRRCAISHSNLNRAAAVARSDTDVASSLFHVHIRQILSSSVDISASNS